MEKQAVIYQIGTGGWEHEAYDRCFYPNRHLESEEKLRFYAQSFNLGEVRATFWDDSLAAEDAQRWIRAVEENKSFLFTVKLHSSFTHKREIKHDVARNVRDVLQELARNDRLGGLVAQFPYPFTNTSAHRFHLTRLAQVFAGFPLYCEFRHESWNQPSLISLLRENGIRPISTDLPKVKQYMPFHNTTSGETAYLRLHGRNEKGWLLNGMDTRYDYLYNRKEILEILRRIIIISGRCKRVIITWNNTTGGKALANAFQCISALRDGKQVYIPRETLTAFPHLDSIALPEGTTELLQMAGYRRVS